MKPKTSTAELFLISVALFFLPGIVGFCLLNIPQYDVIFVMMFFFAMGIELVLTFLFMKKSFTMYEEGKAANGSLVKKIASLMPFLIGCTLLVIFLFQCGLLFMDPSLH